MRCPLFAVYGMRLGILGGTFDPPHLGHLVLAQEAWFELELDRVLFVPARQPPHKNQRDYTPLEHRLAMVALAIRDNPHFELSRADADREGPNYSVDLVHILHEQFLTADLYFVMGLDSLADLPKWHKPDQLIALCQLAVMVRPGYSVDWNSLEEKIPGLRARVLILPKPQLEIASSEIQLRVRNGRPIRYLVTDAVAEYINQNKLYR